MDLLLILIVAVAVILQTSHKVYRSRNPKISSPDAPVLLSYYAVGSSLRAIQHGKMQNLHYSVIIASDKMSVIYRVELPYYSKIHLLGVTRNSGAAQLDPSSVGSVMEAVSLEGDYPEYFSLYADKGMQSLARYVMDPKAMVYTVDFCRSHSWEIVGNELYFVQESSTSREGDETQVFGDIVRFVEEIRPAVEKKLTDKQLKQLSPYGKDRRSDICCPICHEVLQNMQVYYVCPLMHGYLLSGGMIQKIRKGSVILPVLNSPEGQSRDEQLTCPSCNSQMATVDYASSGIIIDSCSNCHYRWIDAGEAEKISSKYKHFS